MQHDVITPPEDLALSDILSVDPLGYDCVREEEIDIAFHATGKGLRLPRTCLPEPCEAALTEFELAGLIGREPTQSEWDDYFSRYSDYCRKEVVAFEEEQVPADTDFDPAVGFWAPLVASYPADAPILASLPTAARPIPGGFTGIVGGAGVPRSLAGGFSGGPTGGSPTGGSPTGGSPTAGTPTGNTPTGGGPTGGDGSTTPVVYPEPDTPGEDPGPDYPPNSPPDDPFGGPQSGNPPGDPDPEDDHPMGGNTPLSPIPLPGGLVLMLTGAACFILRRRPGA